MLSSGGVRHPIIKNEFIKILPKNPSDMKLVFISSAYSLDTYIDFAVEDKKVLKELGFNFIEIDLYKESIEDIKRIMNDVDIIYVEGGNTYVLLDAINKSKISEILKQKLRNGAIYFGTSAGAYVACPTIEMCEWSGDRPNIPELTDLTAMNLVSFMLSVHYNRPNHSNIRDSVLNCKLPVRILKDNQAFIVDDGGIKLVGEGEEVIIK